MSAAAPAGGNEHVRQVIAAVDRLCRERTIYMIGPERAQRLASLVRARRPTRVIECGTAIGYSGLFIAAELQALGAGTLLTIELDPDRARQAEANFRAAGLAEWVDVHVGDARQLAAALPGPFELAFIDCNYPNYAPCFAAIESKLAPGAVVVADNAGIGAVEMADYLEIVRGRYDSHTEWFEMDLPWETRDAMEITVIRPRAEQGSETHPPAEPNR